MKWNRNMKVECLIVDPIGEKENNNYWRVSFQGNLIFNSQESACKD